MFNLPIDNPDVICPDCRRPLVELWKMRDAAGNDAAGLEAGIGGYGNVYTSAGRSILIVELFIGLLDSLFGSLLATGKRHKIEKLAAQTLPEYPKSLICPVCLFLLRRR